MFSILPRGQIVNYHFQRRVIRNLPSSDDVLRGTIEVGAHHITTLGASMRKPLSSCQF